jgi:ankyrin repeat protein
MSSTISGYLRLITLLILVAVSNSLSAQIADLQRVYFDTSAYLPLFYRGAIDYNLIIAASEGYAPEIERLIKKGADVNAEFEEGTTPLIYAVSNNRDIATMMLIKYGADVNKITRQYETPLLIAVKQNNVKIAEDLIRAGADIDFADKHDATALHFASIFNFFQLTDLLIYYDASLDKQASDGYTPLLASVWAGNTEITDLLLQNGANPDIKDNEGFSPYMVAAYYADTITLELLAKKGADIYAVNNSSQNALTLAISAGKTKTVEYLLRKGNKWTDPEREAANPFTIATKFRRKEIIPLLEKNNINGKIAFAIDQVVVTASTRSNIRDIYTGFTIAFKEPWLNAGIIAGFDTKLWNTRVLLQKSDNEYYQYWDKSSVAYAGIFKDYTLTDNPGGFNYLLSTSLMTGYAFGNKLKGTMITPDNEFKIIPAVTLKITKMNLTMNFGIEYLKNPYYHNGPVWIRLGLSYNHFFDNSRSQIKPVKWY